MSRSASAAPRSPATEGKRAESGLWLPTAEADSFSQLIEQLQSRHFSLAASEADIAVIAVAGPETTDTDFTWAEFLRRNNDELVAGWGNLVNRTVSMAAKNFGGIPAAGPLTAALLVGAGLPHAHLATARLGPPVGAAAAGIATSFALGVAVSSLVRSADAALPVSYGLLLPIAFISGVFFPAPTETSWLRSLARFLPAEPIARSMEGAFGSRPPFALTGHQLVVLAVWTVASAVVAALRFSWQPSGPRAGDGRGRRALGRLGA